MGWIIGGSLFAIGAISGTTLLTLGGGGVLAAHTYKMLKKAKKD